MIYHYISLALVLSVCVAQEWELVWSDEFDGGEIDLNNWQHEITFWGGGNSEFQLYTQDPNNSFVEEGMLNIRPTLLRDNINPLTGEAYGADFLYTGYIDVEESYGVCTNTENDGCYREGQGLGVDTEINPIASARLRSYEYFSYRYGRAEVRAKMPVGDWLWPAIWFLPENWCYGDWPVSGEMDLVESIGNEDLRRSDGTPAGMQHMASTMHWGPSRDQNRYYLTGNSNINETTDYGRNFHIYSVEWSATSIVFYVDDIEVLNVPDGVIGEDDEWTGFFDFGNFNSSTENPWETSNEPYIAPFDTQFHFLINIAVGGTNGYIPEPEDAVNRGGDPEYEKPWRNGMSQVEAMNDFYNAEAAWNWTWIQEGENLNMQVDYVRVYKRDDLPPEQEDDCP